MLRPRNSPNRSTQIPRYLTQFPRYLAVQFQIASHVYAHMYPTMDRESYEFINRVTADRKTIERRPTERQYSEDQSLTISNSLETSPRQRELIGIQ